MKGRLPPRLASWTAWTTRTDSFVRDITADVLALAGELRNGTIERVLGMSDIELGLRYLLGKQSSNRG